MGGLDLTIMVIVLVGLWKGFQAGFIRSFVGLVGWFVALVAATRLANDVAPNFSQWVASPVLQTALGFLSVVLAVMVVMSMVVWLLSQILKAFKLSLLDKIAGAVLGVAKNVVVVLVMLSVLAPVLIKTSWWQSSVLAPELLPYAPMAKTLLVDMFGEAWQQINQPDTFSESH